MPALNSWPPPRSWKVATACALANAGTLAYRAEPTWQVWSALREVFDPLGFEIVEVAVEGFLHLKSVCSFLGEGFLLLAEGTVPPTVFRNVHVIPIPADEAYAANCVAVNGSVLMPAGFPATRRAIEAVGLRMRELDNSEIRKADRA